MMASQLFGGKASTTYTNIQKRCTFTKPATVPRVLVHSSGSCFASSVAILKNEDVFNNSRLCADRRKVSLGEAVVHSRKHPFQNLSVCQVSSDCSIEPCGVEESHDLVEGSTEGKEDIVNGVSESISKSLDQLDSSTQRSPLSPKQSQTHGIKHELIMLSLPAIASQAIDPMAQLMETAYIGRLGPIQLAAAGVSISIFNIISKLFNMPLLSVATSFVAEDIAKSSDGEEENTNGKPHHGEIKRRQLSSVSTALFLALCIGIIEASALLLGSGPFLSLMGVSLDSPMRAPAQRFLSLRALGAPAVVLSLALQGILRGFKDTKTPVFCLGVANFAAIFLFPLFINVLQMGVTGAALATVASQYIGSFLMIWFLSQRVLLLPPRFGDLKFGVYLKSGGFLIGRTLAVLITMTIGTSMAARQGPLAMAAHQICLQVWLAVSLLTDALAASAQALVATSMSRGDYDTVKELTNFVLKIGIFTGGVLAIILGSSFGSLANFFTTDAQVLQIVTTGTLFVSASQPLNSLAFIFDGLHYGASDFRYAAVSMMSVGAISSAFLLYAPTVIGLPGVWLGLSLFMGLRMAAGYFRILSKNGPWWFLHAASPQHKGLNQLGSN